jgi:dTDP-4-amino-4,6-dideoxygalactose transaminase
MTVHIGGFVAPSLDDVIEACRARGIPLIEDAAHAFGSSLGGRPAGTIADFGVYSFYPTKVVTSGEGGAVMAQDPGHLEAFRRLRDHGRTRPGATTHDSPGSNWRLSEFHAAVGLAHLRVFGEQTAARARIASRYSEQLADVASLRVRQVPPGCTTSWYKYIAELDEGGDRAGLKARLREKYGVLLAGEVYDRLLTDQPFFSQPGSALEFPQAAQFAAQHICLPIYPELTTGEQDRVIAALRKELS